jgi:hypothetical protein
MRLPKSVIILIVIVIVVLFVAAGIWIGVMWIAGSSSASGLSPYSAVYLSTGDVYFGKLEWFPSPHIEDAWFLQHGMDAKGNPTVGVYPFSQIAWGPAGDLYLNAKQIVFWTRLSDTSSVAEAIANPAAVAPSEMQGDVPAPTPATSTPAQGSSSVATGQ